MWGGCCRDRVAFKASFLFFTPNDHLPSFFFCTLGVRLFAKGLFISFKNSPGVGVYWWGRL